MRLGIRRKLIVLFAVGFFITAATGFLLLWQSVMPSFLKLEADNARSNAARMVAALDAELGNLDTLTLDWANWNDLYDYVAQPNEHFFATNLVPESLRNSQLALVIIADRNGRIVSQNAIDERSARPVEFHLRDTAAGAALRRMIAPDTPAGCGFVDSNAGLLAVCWHPILRSDFTGPANGKLVMGRQLDKQRWEALRHRTDLNFLLQPDLTSQPEPRSWPLTNHPRFLSAAMLPARYTEHAVAIDYALQDIVGMPLGHLHLSQSRDIYQQGKVILLRSALLLALAMAAAVAILVIAMKYWFVDPVHRLEENLAAMRRDPQVGPRLVHSGRDEVGQLADEINGLLRVIEMQVNQLEQLSTTDALTGIANRRAFDTRIDDELARHRRNRGALALLLIDIDFFKQYNDNYGHPAGDHVLRRLAGVMNSAVNRHTDLVARLGGEEFAILLPSTDEAGAVFIAQKVQSNLRREAIAHAYGLPEKDLTVSIGIAVDYDGVEAPEQFISRADRVLYRAKERGRDCFEIA